MTGDGRGSDWQVFGAVALIALGAVLFLDRIGGPWWDMIREAFRFAGSVAWPLALVALGILLLLTARRGGLDLSGSSGKRLYRSRSERMIAGVLGGIATYLGTDPTWVRIVFVILAVVTGFGPAVLVYLVALVIVPEEPKQQPHTAAWPPAPGPTNVPSDPVQAPSWAQQPTGSTETVQSPPPPPPGA
jgi:phage shock protein PspC (stress-responsive transcriptional regulator)